MSLLEIKNATVTVPDSDGTKDILKDVSISFEAKKIYVVTGPNGGGKSTLAKYIMGIIPNDKGQTFLDGEEISEKSIVDRSKVGIGYAFQAPARFKGLKVKKLLELARGNSKNSIRLALKNVGLCPDTYLDRNIDNTFSGGELKRIEIASVIIRDLKVAVFDEPEAGIDLWSFKRMTETFLDLHKNTDTCIIIISHQERIMALADEIVVVDDGKIREVTSHEEFLAKLSGDPETGCMCHRDCVDAGGKQC